MVHVINDAGLALIREFEGFRGQVYLCPAGVPTIGYGSTWDAQGNRMTKSHPPINRKQGEVMLRDECVRCGNSIRTYISAELDVNMYSALISWVYNFGSGRLQSSTLRMVLNRGEYEEVPTQLRRWINVNGKPWRGLIRRREAEINLFMTGF